MICEYCGTPLPGNATKCPACNADVNQPEPPAPAASQAPSPALAAQPTQAAQPAQQPPMQQPAPQPAPQGFPQAPAMQQPPQGAPQKKRRTPLIIGIAAAAVIVVIAVVVVGITVAGGPKSFNAPEAAKAPIQDASALAGELAERYATYTYDDKDDAEQSSDEVRTYDMAHAEIQGGLDRIAGDMEQLDSAGKSWNGYEEAHNAMANVQGALEYEMAVLEAQHNATTNGNSSASAKLEAIKTLYEGYQGIEPPQYLKPFVDGTVAKIPTLYSAVVASAQKPSSALSQRTFSQLITWWLAKQSYYDNEALRILVKQCEVSKETLDGILDNSVNGRKAEAEIDAIDTIAPNLYPSLDSVAIVKITTYAPSQSVMVEAEVAGLTQKFEEKYNLEQGFNCLPIKPALLTANDIPDLSNNSTTQLNVKVTDATTGEVLAQKSQNIDLLSMYDFTWKDDNFGKTASYDILAWLRPQASQVNEVNRDAAEILGKWTNGKMKEIAGYQYGNDWSATLLQVAAIQTAISEKGVAYVMDSYSFTSDQHVLTPDAVVDKKQGLCIETSLLMASCLMSAGMHPMIIITPGHAQVAVETYSGSGNYFLIETTTLPYSGINTKYQASDPAFWNGLLASIKGSDGKAHLVTSSGSSEEWEAYFKAVGNSKLEFNGVFVIDCDLQKIMEIQGLENIS